jgi:pimeloyl-ACP methyl ester carboxylesterase
VTAVWRSESGTGPLVVLVHGSMDRSSSFAKVQRKLDDCTVVRYDRRGYGRSLDAGPATCFQDQVDDLLDVIEARPAVVAGHSLGGVVALAAAQQRPDLVRAVVAYEAPMPWSSWWPRASAGSVVTGAGDPGDGAEAFMRRMIGDERWARLPPSTRIDRRAEGPALVAEMLSVRDAAVPPYDPSLVRVPVVAGHGTASKAHHTQTAVALAEEVEGAELHVIDGAAHGAHASHSDAFAGLIRRALLLGELP